MRTETPTEELKAEAKQILNSLLKIPEGYSSVVAERLIDCVVAAAALEALDALILAREESYAKHAGQRDAP